MCKDIREKIIQFRKDLHQIPELGLEEVKTSQYIKEKLENCGYEYETVIGTGVIACKKSGNTNKAIAFRADMDALQITEETNTSFKSIHKGMMHGCGHDVHMANLLGLAYYLKDIDVSRDIIFIFQPAEESPGGAKPIIETGVLDKYNIGEIYGSHIWPYLEEGTIGVKPGPLMAMPGEFGITISGIGGHGAIPNDTTDQIYIASMLINSLQSIVSRNIEPVEGGVVTVGYIHGGTRHNIIPEKIEFGGTFRAFDEGVYNTIKKRMKEICLGFEVVYNVKIDLKIADYYPAVNNDENLTKEFINILNDENLEIVKPSMTGEDFSFFQKKFPGVFFFMGSKNTDEGFINPLHNPKFNLTDKATYKIFEIFKKVLTRKNIIKNI